MSLLRQVIAGTIVAAALAAPAWAEGGEGGGRFSEGMVTVYTRTGGIIEKTVTDKGMLEAITRDAMVIPAGSMVMMHDGKLYLVMDHKMPDGHMLSDTMTSH